MNLALRKVKQEQRWYIDWKRSPLRANYEILDLLTSFGPTLVTTRRLVANTGICPGKYQIGAGDKYIC